VTAVTVHRSRWFKRPWILIFAIALLVGAICFIYKTHEWMLWVRSTPHFLLYGFPSDRFQKQAYALQDAAKSVLPAAPLSHRALSEHIAVYTSAGEKGLLIQPTELQVFNVTDSRDQDRVIKAVREAVKSHHTIPVRINFYVEHPQSPGQPKAGAPQQITRSVMVGDGRRVRPYH
jgi:hypothetical protein